MSYFNKVKLTEKEHLKHLLVQLQKDKQLNDRHELQELQSQISIKQKLQFPGDESEIMKGKWLIKKKKYRHTYHTSPMCLIALLLN